MNKIIIILLFSFCGLSSTFSTNPFNCYSITAKGSNCEWSEWVDCDIDGVFDYKDKSIYIYSSTIQIFKYKEIVKDTIDNKTFYYILASDSQNESVGITIISFDELIIIHFKYSNGEYMYLIDKQPIN